MRVLLSLLLAVSACQSITVLKDGEGLDVGECIESASDSTLRACLTNVGAIEVRANDTVLAREGVYRGKKARYHAQLSSGALAIHKLDKAGNPEPTPLWHTGTTTGSFATVDSSTGALTLYQPGMVWGGNEVWSSSPTVVVPARARDTVEPVTGTVLRRRESFNGGAPLLCLGAGVRTRALVVSSVNVYAVALYVDVAPARKALKGLLTVPGAELAERADAYAALLKPGAFTRYIMLAFRRSVTQGKVVEALSAVEGVPEAAVAEWRAALAHAIGARVKDGDRLAMGWEGKDRLVVVMNGKTSGVVRSAPLAMAVFKLYLGDDPICPEAKKAFASGIAGLSTET